MKDGKHILKFFIPILCILLFFCMTGCSGKNDTQENAANIFTVRNASRRFAVSDGNNTYFACAISETLVDPSQDEWVSEWSIGLLDSEGNFGGIIYAHIPAGEELFLCDNRIYYKAVDSSRLMCIKTDGSSPIETVMDSGCCKIIGIFKNDLFYIGSDAQTVFRFSLQSFKSEKLTDCASLFQDISTDLSEDNIIFLTMVEDSIYLCLRNTNSLILIHSADGTSKHISAPNCGENETFIPLCVTNNKFYYAISSAESSTVFRIPLDNADSAEELSKTLSQAFLNGYFIVDEYLYYAYESADASYMSSDALNVSIAMINIDDESDRRVVIENLFLSGGHICPLNDRIIYRRCDTGEVIACELSGENPKFLWY